jgi:hypothetical protein
MSHSDSLISLSLECRHHVTFHLRDLCTCSNCISIPRSINPYQWIERLTHGGIVVWWAPPSMSLLAKSPEVTSTRHRTIQVVFGTISGLRPHRYVGQHVRSCSEAQKYGDSTFHITRGRRGSFLGGFFVRLLYDYHRCLHEKSDDKPIRPVFAKGSVTNPELCQTFRINLLLLYIAVQQSTTYANRPAHTAMH